MQYIREKNRYFRFRRKSHAAEVEGSHIAVEKEFDIFFAYNSSCSIIRKWIFDTCDHLESLGMTACFDEKDFIIGMPIFDNMERFLNNSRNIGILITPNFCESYWCSLEVNLAIDIMKKRSDGYKIIPLYLNVTNDKDVPDQLRIFTGLDVSGPHEQWRDELVRMIKFPNRDIASEPFETIPKNFNVTEEEQIFDIFFVYKTSPETSSWVEQTCTALEGSKIVAGYHRIAFVPGRTDLDNLKACLNRTKHVGILITHDFKECRQCRYVRQLVLLKMFEITSKSTEEYRIIPLFLNLTNPTEEIPQELQIFTGLDVSGPQVQWLNKLVSSVTVTNTDASSTMLYHLQKFIEVTENASNETISSFNERILTSPLRQLERQKIRELVDTISGMNK